MQGFLARKNTASPLVSDTTQYNYYGMKNELNSIFGSLGMPFVDSANGSGYWSSMSIKNNAALLQCAGKYLNCTVYTKCSRNGVERCSLSAGE